MYTVCRLFEFLYCFNTVSILFQLCFNTVSITLIRFIRGIDWHFDSCVLCFSSPFTKWVPVAHNWVVDKNNEWPWHEWFWKTLPLWCLMKRHLVRWECFFTVCVWFLSCVLECCYTVCRLLSYCCHTLFICCFWPLPSVSSICAGLTDGFLTFLLSLLSSYILRTFFVLSSYCLLTMFLLFSYLFLTFLQRWMPKANTM